MIALRKRFRKAPKEEQAPRLFCFGLGYSAMALVRRLQARGWRVAGTSRAPSKAERLRAAGLEVFLFDRGLTLAADALQGTTHLLVSVPPDDKGDPLIDGAREDILRCEGMVWAGYLSTTGVYGDREGGWVDEESALRPTQERSRRRAAAERAWRELHRTAGLPVHIFRLAGIYGPGRSVLDNLRRGTAKRIDKPGQVFSRIHVEDIAAVLEASIERPNPGQVYNVCDDDPAAPADVVAYGAELLGLEPPPLVPFDEASLSAMALSFYRDNRRVANRRIHEELGVRLAYPTYREGLQAVLESVSSDQLA